MLVVVVAKVVAFVVVVVVVKVVDFAPPEKVASCGSRNAFTSRLPRSGLRRTNSTVDKTGLAQNECEKNESAASARNSSCISQRPPLHSIRCRIYVVTRM